MAVTVNTDSVSGPASYAAGGFVIATGLATVGFLDIQLIAPGANLPAHRLEVARDTPVAGSATIKVMVESYQKLPATLGNVSGLPGSVSARATSGGVESVFTTGHIHTIDHNHAVTPASTAPAGASAATLALALQPNATTHTHTLDLPNFTGNTAAIVFDHTHIWNSIYQHQHSVTNTETNVALAELTAGTNISGASWQWMAADA